MPVAASKAGSHAEPAFGVPERLTDDAELWLIRHGETEWSRSGQHTGRTDLPLTAAGELQARALRPLLADIAPVLVLCSPLQRATETARLAELTVTATDDDLAEWDYGDYEGRSTDEIRESVPGWTLWTHGVPNGETIAQVRDRADRVLRRSAEALPDGPVVLIAHGHISRIIGARWIGLPATGGANLALGTAAPSLLGVQHGAPSITRWNLPNPATSEDPS